MAQYMTMKWLLLLAWLIFLIGNLTNSDEMKSDHSLIMGWIVLIGSLLYSKLDSISDSLNNR